MKRYETIAAVAVAATITLVCQLALGETLEGSALEIDASEAQAGEQVIYMLVGSATPVHITKEGVLTAPNAIVEKITAQTIQQKTSVPLVFRNEDGAPVFMFYSDLIYAVTDTMVNAWLGVGVAPSYPLTVRGDSYLDGDVIITGETTLSGNSTAECLSAESSAGLELCDDEDNTGVFVGEDGQVAVGHTNPTAALDVNGTAKISSDAEIGGQLSIGKPNPTVELDVNGDAKISGSLSVNGTSISGYTGGQYTWDPVNHRVWYWWIEDGMVKYVN